MQPILIAFSILLLLLPSFTGELPQQPNNKEQKPQPTQNPISPDSVVRITTRLFQIDAVVVDKDGKLVTDLKPEDFKIIEDKKEQKITHFSFVTLQPETPKAEVSHKEPYTNAGKLINPPIPAARLNRSKCVAQSRWWQMIWECLLKALFTREMR